MQAAIIWLTQDQHNYNITDDADKILDNHNGDLNIFHKFYFNRHAILIQASTFKFNNSCFGPFLSTEINSPVSYTTHYT